MDNLQVAPLRVRPADIADLQKLFARSIAKSRGQGTLELTKEAVLQLESYTFPGNIKASFVPSVSYMFVSYTWFRTTAVIFSVAIM